MSTAREQEDKKAFHDDAVKRWRQGKPKSPHNYDGPPPTEDDVAYYNDSLQKWAESMPTEPNDDDWRGR